MTFAKCSHGRVSNVSDPTWNRSGFKWQQALPISSPVSLDANTQLMNYKLTGNYEDLKKIRAILQ